MDVGLVILDGWALAPDTQQGRDAVGAARTPNFDRLWETGAHSTLETHGRRVGLPEGQMGNSEVGHLNIGAGRVVKQESARVSDAIARWKGHSPPDVDPDDVPIHENDAIQSAFEYADKHDGQVHFLGLVSDGGVHSYQSHLHALLELAADRGVDAVTHAFTDGRDTAPESGAGYLAELDAHVEDVGTGEVATVSGRYYAMDRDRNWDRTRRAYDAVVNREAEHTADSAVAAVEASYDRGDADEFLEPTLVEGGPALSDGDGAVFVNFRSDRARQLTRMLADIRPGDWDVGTDAPDIRLVTMTEYDATFDVPVAFPPRIPENTLGEVLSAAGKTQLRLAETEKYAHVTYFLNGGREVEFDGEIREIVQSPDVPTYDEQPEMSAPEVTDTAIDIIEGGPRSDPEQSRGSSPRDGDDPDAMVLNYANPDMVGHTGDFDAAVAAVEAVDEQLGRLVDTLDAAGAHVLVTADHGNADDMGTPEKPHTAHTTNPVPFIARAPDGTDGGLTVRDGGTLADIAPTMLALAGVDQPQEMTGTPLVE